MSISIATVEQYLHDHIPMTRHLGIAVRAFDGSTLRLARQGHTSRTGTLASNSRRRA